MPSMFAEIMPASIGIFAAGPRTHPTDDVVGMCIFRTANLAGSVIAIADGLFHEIANAP